VTSFALKILFASVALALPALADPPVQKGRPTSPVVALELAVAVGGDRPALVAVLTNLGPGDLTGPMFNGRDHRFVVASPDGEFASCRAFAVRRPKTPDPLVAGQSLTWEVPVDALFEDRPGPAGIYKFRWAFGGVSKTVALYRKDAVPGDPPPPGLAPNLTPKGAVREFLQALGRDPARLGSVLHVADGSPAEEAAKTALTSRALAGMALHDACVERFGADVVGDWHPEPVDQPLAALPKRPIRLSDDLTEAFVDMDGYSYRVVHASGAWGVSSANFLLDGRPHPEIIRRTKATQQAAADVRAGKFAKFTDAAPQIVSRIERRP
jgi:hypothetical protein